MHKECDTECLVNREAGGWSNKDAMYTVFIYIKPII